VTARATVPAEADVTVGVVRVAEVARTTFPDPDELSHDASVPLDVRNVLFAPIAVRPVPPFATGSAVPE
jgi:hypothetical protein